MTFKIINCIIFLATIFSATAQVSERGKADYSMQIVLDEVEKAIIGSSEITWRNPSESAVGELQFHLYYNAFKNTESTFMQGRDDFGFLMKSLKDGCGWSYSEVLEILDEDGNNLISEASYIAPDDGNSKDQTVLKVPLKIAVQGKTSQKYVMKWRAKIPKAMIRTGYNQDYYFFAQWYPKLGVYEPAGMRYQKKGAWNCHQYHSSGEYYGEFGDYQVSLDVPSDFVVGASGSLLEEKVMGERKVWTFAVDNVIDFSWTCSPHFEHMKDSWEEVDLNLYTYPAHAHFAERYFTTAKQSLEYMKEHVGVYPYATLSIIDPPLHGLFTGGMEYPTFISSICSNILPAGIKAPETLIVHEFVHQYFMQMLASHEQEEPWMDEGITTYYEGRILDEYYGEKTSLLDVAGIQLGNEEYNRYEFWSSQNPKIADNSFKARDFTHGGYSPIAYNKTASMLKTLEGIIGLEKMDKVMKKYFETWKFHHPSGSDFVNTFKSELDSAFLSEVKLDLEQFFDQALYGSVECDYTVRNIKTAELGWKGGFIKDTEDCLEYGRNADEKQVVSRVIVERLGELILPLEILIVMDDGTTNLVLWDGASRSTEVTVMGEPSTFKVQLDPQRKLDLEKNVLNNAILPKTSTAYKKYTSRFKVGMQHLLDFLNFLS